MITFILTLIVFLFAGWAFLSIIIWSLRNGISPMPTSSKAKQCLLSAVPANFNGIIYELGSGWGTLAFPLAERFPQSQVIAYESAPVPYFFSKIRHLLAPLPNLQIQRQDFFQVPLANAGLIVCYLYPGAMHRLKRKFEQELNPNTLVVSNTFGIPGWQPHKVFEVADIYRTKIYLYQT